MIPLLIISLLASILVYRSSWFRIEGLSPVVVLGSFLLKVIVGFLLLWVYGQVLEIDRADADVFKYFDDAVVLHSSVSESSELYWGIFSGEQIEAATPYYHSMYNWDRSINYFHLNDNRTVIRLHSLILFFSQGDIRVHQVIFSLISFLGLVFLFKGLRKWATMPAWTFVLICVLPPSLLFWASGLLKETLVMLPLGLVIYGLAHLEGSKKAVWAITLGLLGFCVIKPYVGLCLLPSILFLGLIKLLRGRLWLSFFSTSAIILILVWLADSFSDLNLVGHLAAEQSRFLAFARSVEAGSLIEVQSFSDLPSFIRQVPNAISNCLFRPMIWEVRSGLDMLSAVENSGYLLLIVLAIVWRRNTIALRPVLFSLLFILSLSVLVGSVTPVLGAIVRYKAPLLPFLIFAVLQVLDLKRIPFVPNRVE